jgi:hypothetical protein
MESHPTESRSTERAPAPAAVDAAARYPFCRHLWSKKRFLGAGPPRDEAELLDGSQACWCSVTHQKLGPDRAVADPDLCRAGRTCFEPTLGGSWRAQESGGTMHRDRAPTEIQP